MILNKKILTIEVVNETTNIALNISKVLSQNELSKQIFIPMGLSDRKNHIAKDDTPMLYHFLIDKDTPLSDWVVFEITYDDLSGLKYKQRVICICDKYGIEINPFLPELV